MQGTIYSFLLSEEVPKANKGGRVAEFLYLRSRPWAGGDAILRRAPLRRSYEN